MSKFCASLRVIARHCASFSAVFFILCSLVITANGQDCSTVLDVDKLRRTNPVAYREHLRIEKFIADYRKQLGSNPNARLIDNNGTITIPLVFHVLHRGEAVGTGTNLSDAQIIGQVAFLNQCFSQINNQVGIPQPFLNVAGNPNFRFEIACTDPTGANTTGILRKQTSANFSTTTQNAKLSNQGGDDAWAIERFLNVWITPNLDPTAQFPQFGSTQGIQFLSSNQNTDGVTVRFDAVGVSANNFIARNSGATLIHEIGHWLGLIHLYDGGCSNNDGCADTPPQLNRTNETVPCPIIFPLNPNACGSGTNSNGDMFDNFMDGTNDACGRKMFTNDQIIRMRAVFQPGGPRRSFIDNYFTLQQAYASCSNAGGFYIVRTPFCAARGNINWSVTGPATLSNPNDHSTTNYALPQSTGNGVATITASWNNLAADFTIPVGYGAENSTYTHNYGTSNLINGATSINGYNRYTYINANFTGAIGPAKNWRLVSSTAPVSLSPTTTTNNFWIYMTQPYQWAIIRAEIPTQCGDRTVEYTFLSGYVGYNYAISPNPASNDITISASVPNDPNNRAANPTVEAYEVQIFDSSNQLLKKTKVKKDERDVTIDVSRFSSNQFYTVKLISGNDVQTKTFFKQ